ncbi:MAG: Transposase IS200 like protein [bacterium ADurb.Bin429]|nr:MAG: Transposase IS200 like protein [bacterium ADurb.Bin429]
MARLARIVIPGMAHHVTQRGNLRAQVFWGDFDYREYLALLAEHLAHLELLAYCLMPNHVHLIPVPDAEDALADVMKAVQQVYARRLNAHRGVTGHLWQSRYYSCVMDDAHMWAAIRYVERNPVRAGLVARAEDYPWSSAAAHCGLRVDPLLSVSLLTECAVEDWATWLRIEDDVESTRIRTHTDTGRPCGSRELQQRISTLLGRPVTPQKTGRKPRYQTSSVKR